MMFFKCNSWQTDTVIKHRAKSPVLFAFETTKTVWIIPDGVSLDIENYCTVSLFFEQTYL